MIRMPTRIKNLDLHRLLCKSLLVDTSLTWRGIGVSIPLPRQWQCRALPIELIPRILVDAAGVEPAVPEAADLQSTGVTNFPTHPKSYTTDFYMASSGLLPMFKRSEPDFLTLSSSRTCYLMYLTRCSISATAPFGTVGSWTPSCFTLTWLSNILLMCLSLANIKIMCIKFGTR